MASRFRIVLLFTLVSVGIVTSSAKAQHLSPTEFASELRLAEVYEQTRDFDNAIRVYEELHKADSTNLDVFNGLVRDYFYVKRFTDVEDLIKSKLQEHEGDQELLLLLARTEAKLNKKDDALAAFKKAEAAVAGDDCMMVMPIASALVEVNYTDQAMELLKHLSASDNINCAGPAANLYLRMGKYGDATKLYLTLLKSGEGNLSFIESRIAQFTTDSTSRSLTLDALNEEIAKAEPMLPALELLAWMYSEEKDYAHAYEVISKIDSMNGTTNPGNQGFELLVFAEKARNEGALNVAVKAYDEAIRRIKLGSGKQNDYFLAQAELGALKTTEAFYAQKPGTSAQEYTDLISRYEAYGANQQFLDFAMEALLRSATLSYTKLFDLKRASDDYQRTVAKTRLDNERSRVALFGLVDVSLASGNFTEATERLNAIDNLLDHSQAAARGLSEKEPRLHVLYERALVDYYQMNFDTAITKLKLIVAEPGSDYANDAIALGSTIAENKKAANIGALKIFATANLAEFKHDFAGALGAYQTIATTYSTSPIADQAMLRAANIQVSLGKAEDAVTTLETMQEKLPSSPLLDEGAFREAEIVERELKDKKRAEKLYEDFLARFPRSTFDDDARERARKLRGDVF
jgi:tetratricopeptide (TPR) repeat protein